MEPEKFAETAIGFTKSPLGIIALFIVLVYGFASFVVGFGNGLSEHILSCHCVSWLSLACCETS